MFDDESSEVLADQGGRGRHHLVDGPPVHERPHEHAVLQRDVAHLILPDDVQALPVEEDAAPSSPEGRVPLPGIAPPARALQQALERIDDGSYGFCEETGEPIGLKRLEARPVATLCLEAQERRELAERQFRDRDDRYR